MRPFYGATQGRSPRTRSDAYDQTAETLVIVDTTARARELAHALPAIPYIGRRTGAVVCQSLAAFDWHSRLETTAVALRDWNWQDADAAPHERSHARHDPRNRVRTRFDHDHRRFHRDDGDARARRDLEARTALSDLGVGESDVIEMLPGHVVTLRGLPRPDLDGDYLLVSVAHRGEAPDEEQFATDAPQSARYANTFECIPATTPYAVEIPSSSAKCSGG